MRTAWLLAIAIVFVLLGMGVKVYKIIYPETPSAFVWALNGIAVVAVLVILFRAVKSYLERLKEKRALDALPMSQKAGRNALKI